MGHTDLLTRPSREAPRPASGSPERIQTAHILGASNIALSAAATGIPLDDVRPRSCLRTACCYTGCRCACAQTMRPPPSAVKQSGAGTLRSSRARAAPGHCIQEPRASDAPRAGRFTSSLVVFGRTGVLVRGERQLLAGRLRKLDCRPQSSSPPIPPPNTSPQRIERSSLASDTQMEPLTRQEQAKVSRALVDFGERSISALTGPRKLHFFSAACINLSGCKMLRSEDSPTVRGHVADRFRALGTDLLIAIVGLVSKPWQAAAAVADTVRPPALTTVCKPILAGLAMNSHAWVTTADLASVEMVLSKFFRDAESIVPALALLLDEVPEMRGILESWLETTIDYSGSDRSLAHVLAVCRAASRRCGACEAVASAASDDDQPLLAALVRSAVELGSGHLLRRLHREVAPHIKSAAVRDELELAAQGNAKTARSMARGMVLMSSLCFESKRFSDLVERLASEGGFDLPHSTYATCWSALDLNALPTVDRVGDIWPFVLERFGPLVADTAGGPPAEPAAKAAAAAPAPASESRSPPPPALPSPQQPADRRVDASAERAASTIRALALGGVKPNAGAANKAPAGPLPTVTVGALSRDVLVTRLPRLASAMLNGPGGVVVFGLDPSKQAMPGADEGLCTDEAGCREFVEHVLESNVSPPIPRHRWSFEFLELDSSAQTWPRAAVAVRFAPALQSAPGVERHTLFFGNNAARRLVVNGHGIRAVRIPQAELPSVIQSRLCSVASEAPAE